jgi:hypothetical protein
LSVEQILAEHLCTPEAEEAEPKEQRIEERRRRLEHCARELEEREHALRGSDVRWWASDTASSH